MSTAPVVVPVADPFEGALWRNIPLRERLPPSRRRRYLRSLLHRLRIALLLPGDRVTAWAPDVAGEVLRADGRGVLVRDERTGERFLLDREDITEC